MNAAPAEAARPEPNDYEVAARGLYEALDSIHTWEGQPYPQPRVAAPFRPYRQDGGVWQEGEHNADSLVRGGVAVLAAPRCTVTAVLERSQEDPTSYMLYVSRTVIDMDTYMYTYQDLSLRAYEIEGKTNLMSKLTLADILDLTGGERDGRSTVGLPQGVKKATLAKTGYVDLGQSRSYEDSDGDSRAALDNTIELATAMAKGINWLGMPEDQFQEKYGEYDNRVRFGGRPLAVLRTARLAVWNAIKQA